MIQARGKLPHFRVVQWLGMCWLDFGRCSHATWWNVSCFSFKFWVKEQKKLRREFYGFLIINHVSCDTAFLSEDATNVSPNGEDAKDCWSAKLLRVNSSAISKALFAKWTRRWARASGNICQFTILQASVTTGNVIGCSIYQDELYHHRDSITLREFPVIRAR